MTTSSTTGPTRLTQKAYRLRCLLAGVLSFPALMVLSAVVGVLLLLALGSLNVPAMVAVALVCEVLLLVSVLDAVGRVSSWRWFLRLKEFTLRKALVGVACGAGLWGGLQAVAHLAQSAGVEVASSDTSSGLLSMSGVPFLLVVGVLVPFVIPFFEEVLFRGMLLRLFSEGAPGKVGTVLGVVFSSVYFALAHTQGASTFTDLFTVVWAGAIGLVHCLLVLRQDSVAGSCFSHMTYNGITVLVAVVAAW